MSDSSAVYALGHSEEELRRLDEQGANLRPFTERLLHEAGLGPGMRVLDAGSGTGDVSVLAAQLVGADGEVVGVDRAPEALATARQRVAGLGLGQVRFVEGDLTSISFEQPFDAVIGRQILIHQPDPQATLTHLVGLLRPGGVVAFVEMVMREQPYVWPARPLYERSCAQVAEALQRATGKAEMGLRLASLFEAAGLRDPHMRFEGVSAVGADTGHLSYLTATMRTFVPLIERFGIASAAEIDIDTLLERLVAEATQARGFVCAFMLNCAWARKPPA
jgi:SAM-dependent methyltransferase